MLEMFLRKNRPELIINDLDRPEPEPPKPTPKKRPLTFEEQVMKTIKEYENLRELSHDP